MLQRRSERDRDRQPAQTGSDHNGEARFHGKAPNQKIHKTDMYTANGRSNKRAILTHPSLTKSQSRGLRGFSSRTWRLKALCNLPPNDGSCHRLESLMPRKPQTHGHDTRYVKMQKNYCFACGMNNPARHAPQVHARRSPPNLRLQIPPQQALHRTARPLPRRHHRHHPRRRHGQGQQAPPRRRPDQRNDRRISQARPAAQAAARRGQGSQCTRPPCTSTKPRSATKRTKSWPAAAEPSSPSTPKKCSPNMLRDSKNDRQNSRGNPAWNRETVIWRKLTN